MNDMAEKLRVLESGKIEGEVEERDKLPRIIQNFTGYHWLMERMRPGQGKKERLNELPNELSGNDFSWNKACVPGDVYTDLYRAGELDDPFYGRNMGRCKWVQDYEWWYNYTFNVSQEMKGKKLTLIFEGVDYSCEVWLNTVYLGRHEGMMSSFKFDVTSLVDFNSPHVPSNLLTIKLDPPPKNQQNFAGMKHNFAGDYLTGLIPFGIWKPVKLIATSKLRIDNYRVESYIQQDDSAEVQVEIEIQGLENEQLNTQVEVMLKDQDKKYIQELQTIIEPGHNKVLAKIKIEKAKLWWPYELGEPFRYDFRIMIKEGERALDSIEGKVGIREIHMERNPGFTEEEVQNPWTFIINGKAMFLRSACWGGQPSFFYGRNSREKYRYFLEAAKECHINNLRIFGWHPAETEDFYDLCDELGITVWTNFSFATQIFREDDDYISQVKHEIAEIVKDRRNHPSTIMWMGGEEVFFSEAHVKSGNRRLMQLIGEVVRQHTHVPYADASPLSSREAIRMGYKPKESFHANSHYYAAGLVFMEDYYPNLDYCIIPELTAASAPSIESLKKFIPPDELWPMGLSWGYHAGDMHVLEILNYEVFGDTCKDSIEHFVEATQIAQGTIFQYALEHFRRKKPHVSGVALCHFITNWPIIKWDIIDYYGKKKRSFDFVKASYQPLLVSMAFPKRRYLPGENFEAHLWVVNDYDRPFKNLEYRVEIYNMKGEKQKDFHQMVEITPNSSNKYMDIGWEVKGIEGENFKVELKLVDEEGNLLSHNEYTLLIMDQEKAKQEAFKLNRKMIEARDKYGRGYYRYAPERLVEW